MGLDHTRFEIEQMHLAASLGANLIHRCSRHGDSAFAEADAFGAKWLLKDRLVLVSALTLALCSPRAERAQFDIL
jgi:hypothetical protein